MPRGLKSNLNQLTLISYLEKCNYCKTKGKCRRYNLMKTLAEDFITIKRTCDKQWIIINAYTILSVNAKTLTKKTKQTLKNS